MSRLFSSTSRAAACADQSPASSLAVLPRDTALAIGPASSTSRIRDRVLRSAMALICRQGVSGTGLRQVVAHAGAPWGSLQHYFPGGKEQLVREALALAGATASRTVGRLREGGRAARDRPQRPAPFAVTTISAGPDRTVRARGGLPLGADLLLAEVLARGTAFAGASDREPG
jgi:AcrR family transcriptional regulator